MTNLYVLKIHTDGYPAELDPTSVTPGDILQLPSTKFDGIIDADANEIINVGTPQEDDSAATKGYVDAIAAGLTPHEAVLVKTDHKLGTQANLVGAGGTWTGALTTGDSFTVTIDGGTPTEISLLSAPADRAATIAAINSIYGSTIAYAGSAGQIDLRSPSYGADSSVEVTLADAVWDTEVGIDDGTADGLSFTPSGAYPNHIYTAPSNSTSFNTIDGILLAVNDRVLVSMEGGDDVTAELNNGVYFVKTLGNGSTTSFVLQRSTDADQAIAGEVARGLYVFITDGTINKSTGWALVTAGTITLETTPLLFTQFIGVPWLSYDRGLKRVVDSVDVELDATADGQGGGYTTADRKSGLEFSSDSAAGKLRVAVHATGGLERYQTTPFGMAIKLDNTDGDNTLGLSSDGIKVLGLPELFTIDNVAVDALVTADNLSELVDGSLTTLHAHPGAGEAERTEYDFIADGAIALGDPVYLTSAGKVQKADAGVDAKAFACGIAREATDDTDPCPVTMDGIAKSVFSTDKTIGLRWFVANGGGLTSSVPGSGKHVMQVGFTCAVRDLLVQKQYIGKKV